MTLSTLADVGIAFVKAFDKPDGLHAGKGRKGENRTALRRRTQERRDRVRCGACRRLVYFDPCVAEVVAIRCEQCLDVFCRPCARNHFAASEGIAAAVQEHKKYGPKKVPELPELPTMQRHARTKTRSKGKP